MASDKTKAYLIESLTELAGEPAVMESDFFNDLGMDSLDLLEYAMIVERDLKISIPDEVEEGFRNLNEVAAYLDSVNAEAA